MTDVNRVQLAGFVEDAQALRSTPAGLPVLKFKLRHISDLIEAGRKRRVECVMTVVTLGEMAGTANEFIANGKRVRVEGFLAKAGMKSDWPELHAENIVIID